MSSTVRGRFITLEGGEGAGKSTQIRRLAEALAARGLPVRITREPGGSPGAEEIRALVVSGEPGRWSAVTEALLMTSARRDHVERTVWPALAAGEWVLCDRFFDSTMAYQGYGHGLGPERIAALQALALDGFRPDLTLILDLPVEVGLRRAAVRAAGVAGAGGDAEDRYEQMDRDFHKRLRDGFLAIAEADPARCAVIDADRTVDEITSDLVATVEQRLHNPGGQG